MDGRELHGEYVCVWWWFLVVDMVNGSSSDKGMFESLPEAVWRSEESSG